MTTRSVAVPFQSTTSIWSFQASPALKYTSAPEGKLELFTFDVVRQAVASESPSFESLPSALTKYVFPENVVDAPAANATVDCPKTDAAARVRPSQRTSVCDADISLL